jgi:hypothetical protein
MQCKWAKSLGELEATHQEIWGTSDYTDRNKPVVFFGLYDLRDYIALYRHKKGSIYILWAGSDILNLQNKFLFNNGKLKLLSKLFPFFHKFIVNLLKRKVFKHYCENEVEQEALEKLGIKADVQQSYLGNIYLPTTFEYSSEPKVFISCGKDRQIEYGFDIVEKIAKRLPKVKFYLYGDDWETDKHNIIVRGRVSKEQFNNEIANMQIGLRLNKFDGFSEVLAKALLRGQYAISKISYPFVYTYKNEYDLVELIKEIVDFKKPNIEAKEYYKKTLNNFVWSKYC